MVKKIIFSLFLFFSSSWVFAQSPLVIYSDANSNAEITDKVQLLEDKEAGLTIGQVMLSDKFVNNTGRVLNLGFSKSAFWVKVVLKNTTETNHLLLELSQPSIDSVEFYNSSPGETMQVQKLTKWAPLSARKYRDLLYIFDLDVKPNEIQTCFLRIKGDQPIQLTLTVGTPKSIFELMETVDFFSGIYVGIMLVMILYNFFIYFIVKDRSYLYYVLYIAFVLFTQTDYPLKYLWPDIPWTNVHALSLFPCLAAITGLLFMQRFLKTKEYEPLLDKISYFFFALFGCSVLFSLFNNFVVSTHIMEPLSALLSLYMLFMAIRIYRKGYRPAKFFLIGWTIFLVGVMVFIFKDLGIFPYNVFTRYTMQFGSACDVILLSLGLADRIKTLNEEKEEKTHQLQKAYNELNRFAYSASHDLKAPISTITSVINLAKLEHAYESNEYLPMIESCINQLDEFTTSIINYFLNQNKEKLINDIDFESLLQKLIGQIKAYRDTSGVRFSIHIQQTEPFYGDDFRLHMILINLISNSIVHRNPSLETTLIEIDVAVTGETATIQIKDNGNGIAPEHLEHIFEMFYRASSSGAGSGLGLYIVKESIDTLDGTITVTSTLGQGTCFQLVIPSKKLEEIA